MQRIPYLILISFSVIFLVENNAQGISILEMSLPTNAEYGIPKIEFAELVKSFDNFFFKDETNLAYDVL